MEIEIRPSPKQAEFFRAKTRFVGYGGAKGGGKSWAVRKKAMLLGLRYPGINMLLLRRTMPELRENHVLPLQKELHGVASYKDSEKVFNFRNGSRLKLGYCDNEGDVLQYQGQSYDVLFLDEATNFTEYQYDQIKTVIRGVNDFPKRTYITCNPGGVGHAWVKRLFIDRQFRDGENPEDYTFIQARVWDNRALIENDPYYVDTLRSLPEKQRRAYLDGDWNVLEGQYFAEWDPSVHVMRPFPLPPTWRRYFTMDYGLDMLAGYWIAIDEYGRGYAYREIYEKGLIVSEAAAAIRQATGKEEEIFAYMAPPDMWNRKSDTGKSVAEIFSEQGIYLSRAKNDRILGWYDMHEWLKVGADETGAVCAGLRFFPVCKNAIRTIPLLQFDDKKVEDVKNEPHEITHAPDAIRYFCAGRPLPAMAPVWSGAKPGDYEEQVEEFLNYR